MNPSEAILREIQQLYEDLKIKSDELDRKEANIENLITDKLNYMKQEMEIDLIKRADELNSKELQLTDFEQELDRRCSDIELRILQRDNEFKERERILKQKETLLKEKERLCKEREKTLKEGETKLEERESKLKERELQCKKRNERLSLLIESYKLKNEQERATCEECTKLTIELKEIKTKLKDRTKLESKVDNDIKLERAIKTDKEIQLDCTLPESIAMYLFDVHQVAITVAPDQVESLFDTFKDEIAKSLNKIPFQCTCSFIEFLHYCSCRLDISLYELYTRRNQIQGDSIAVHILLRLTLYQHVPDEERLELIHELAEFLQDSSIKVRLYTLYYNPIQILYAGDERCQVLALKVVYLLSEIPREFIYLWQSQVKACSELGRIVKLHFDKDYSLMIKERTDLG